MSYRSSGISPATSLTSGSEGELVQVRIATEPRCLEELLECLASLSFPINPQLYHGVPTTVEFPAYQNRLAEVRNGLRAHSFDPDSMRVSSMIEAISAA